MSAPKRIGLVKAHIPKGATGNEKSKYLTVGAAWQEEDGMINIKLDLLPMSFTGWAGWLNIFPPEEEKK